MVANRVDKGGLPGSVAQYQQMMTKLIMSEDSSYAKNIPGWEEGLKSTFATANLGWLLTKFSSMKAPPEQVASLQVRREMRIVISNMKRGFKEVKSETEVKSYSQVLSPSKASGSPSASSKSKSEDEKQEMMEEIVRENARTMIEQMQLEHAQSESRGVRKEVIYLEYLTGTPKHLAWCNSNMTESVEVTSVGANGKKVFTLYEPESDLKRMQRQAGWQLITRSVGDMPKENWKGIALGDVYGLYALIVSHYRENDRKSVVKELNARLAGLTKSSRELFITFRSRYEQLTMEIQKVGMKMDDDVLFGHVERALTQSDDEKVRETYKFAAMFSGGKLATTKELFEKMTPAMQQVENSAHTRASMNENEINAENEKKKKKKEKEKKEKTETAARAFKAQTHDSTDRTGTNSDIMGTCFEYSKTGKCPRTNCTFRHQRLSEKDNETLLEGMKKSRENQPCFKCGQKGHIATYCKTDKTETKTAMITMSQSEADSLHAMRDHTQNMSDEQVKLFARTLIAQRAEAVGKDQA